MSECFLQTYTGRIVDLEHLDPTDVEVVDVAHATSKICRYSGHPSLHYSVAQHMVHVSQYLQHIGEPPIVQFAGLCHDAAEAYIGDIHGPLKRLIYKRSPVIKEIEDKIEEAIGSAWSVKLTPMDKQVHLADLVMLGVEKRTFMGGPDWEILENVPKWPEFQLSPLEAREAKRLWLDRWFELYERCKVK